MTSQSSMQPLANHDTGYAGEVGLHSSETRPEDVFRVSHGSSGEDLFARDIARPEQQPQHLHPPSSSLSRLASALGSVQDALNFCQLISSAGPEVLTFVIHLSKLNEITLQLCINLGLLARTSESVAYLAYGLFSVPEEVLLLLGTLGPANRRILGTNLREACHNNSSRTPLPAFTSSEEGGRRSSVANILSPASVACSSTSRSSIGSQRRTTPRVRYFCPDIDCTHKPEGFTQYGYLTNHVKMSHASLTENSDWEEQVEIQRPGEDLPKRRRSRQQKKRRAEPSTPDGNPRRVGTMVLGLDTDVPTGNFSPSRFNNEADRAYPPKVVDGQWYHPVTDLVHSGNSPAPTTPTFLFDPPPPVLQQHEMQTSTPGNHFFGEIPPNVWPRYSNPGLPPHSFQPP